MNQSTYMTKNTNTIKEMPNTTYDSAICNMKNKTTDILRGANRYGLLEDSDVECTRIGRILIPYKNSETTIMWTF